MRPEDPRFLKWLRTSAASDIVIQEDKSLAIILELPKRIKKIETAEEYHNALCQMQCDYVNGDLIYKEDE